MWCPLEDPGHLTLRRPDLVISTAPVWVSNRSAGYSRASIYAVSLFTTASQARQRSTVRPTLSLHPDDLVTAIDIDHLARDRGGSITRQKHPGLT